MKAVMMMGMMMRDGNGRRRKSQRQEGLNIDNHKESWENTSDRRKTVNNTLFLTKTNLMRT